MEAKKGRALLYQNVDGKDPKFTTVDYHSINKDLPVISGTKILLKYFLHPYNFVESQRWDCATVHSEM